MAWVNWNRKPAEAPTGTGPIGLDLNATRARAALGKSVRNKLLPLGETHPDFPIAINLDKRPAEIGPSASRISRKLPHLVCAGYLAMLGLPHEWKGNRVTLNPESATLIALEKIRQLCAMAESVAVTIPVYFTLPQVTKLLAIADKAKLKIRGTVTLPMALAAERATHYLHGQAENAPPDASRNGKSFGTTSVLIVDADDYALTASIVRISEEEVRQVATTASTRTGSRMWRERMLDALSDRCVRICRRDPRDNADVEQMLFDQIEEAFDRAKEGQRVSIQVRSTHWYQDLIHTPVEFDAFCANLARFAIDDIRQLIASANLPESPRAIWLTHDAGRLPGLASALHQNMAVASSVRVLHPEAAAAAAANLVDRWANGELPKTHLDTLIPLPPRPDPRLVPKSVKSKK